MSGATRVLVIDDDPMFRKIVAHGLEETGFQVVLHDGSGDISAELTETAPDIVLLDLVLPETTGLEVLSKMSASPGDVRVIMVTGTNDLTMAVRAMRAGAFDYITKPVNLDELVVTMERAVESLHVARERDLYRDRHERQFRHVETRNPRMLEIYELARKVARSETTTVLIEGESGTGKEHVANLIHQRSPRADKPFLEINCASLPEPLLESELFGHEKGAFTDATDRKRGLLELADGGTLFLDEVGEMALPIQVKLLRVVERMCFRRVGGTADVNVSVRIISATNRDLERSVKEGTMREDLYFRLKVVPIRLPPLRERREDLPLLVQRFMTEFAAVFGRPFRGVTADAMAAVYAYDWPGNIRELRNCMERAVLLNDGEELTAPMLQIPAATSSGEPDDLLRDLREILGGGIPDNGIDFERLVGDVERLLITQAAEKANWNQTQAARLLGLNRDKLRTRMKNHGLGGRRRD